MANEHQTTIKISHVRQIETVKAATRNSDGTGSWSMI